MLPRATSFDNLPRINQRRKVETDDVHLWLDSIVVVNHSTNDGVLNFAVVKVDADFVADLEVALWFLGCHENSRFALGGQPYGA